MKIAQIAPIAERVPPKKYGGTERVVYTLTEELVKRGHEVTLFASGDSITFAKLTSVIPKSLREMNIKDLYGTNTWSMLNTGIAYQKQDEFDIIHDHNGHLSAPVANLSTTPVVITLHGSLNNDLKYLYEALEGPHYVTVSNAQAKFAPNLHYAGTVYNGLDMKDYPISLTNNGYLLFVGRISREKGVHFAVKVAKALDLPLIIAAKLDRSNQSDIAYFHRHIKPELSEKIRWIGEVDETERNKLMSQALCFLHPVTWPEPFGLTLIESMACGTPVVAFNLGSIPEVISQGKSGFIVSNFSEMIQAVKNIHTINRSNCRKYALENFSHTRMADGYEEIYQKIFNLKHKEVLSPEFDLFPTITTRQELFTKNIIQGSRSSETSFSQIYAHQIKIKKK